MSLGGSGSNDFGTFMCADMKYMKFQTDFISNANRIFDTLHFCFACTMQIVSGIQRRVVVDLRTRGIHDGIVFTVCDHFQSSCCSGSEPSTHVVFAANTARASTATKENFHRWTHHAELGQVRQTVFHQGTIGRVIDTRNAA